MNSRHSLAGILGAALLAGPGTPGICAAKDKAAAVTNREVRAAIERSLPYLEREGVVWIEEKKCVSCHAVTSMLWSLSAAKARGFAVEGEKLEEWYRWSVEQSAKVRDDPEGNLAAENLIKLMLGRDGYAEGGGKLFADFPRDIVEKQEEDGSWKAGGQLPFQKRPKPETNEVSTMWAALALGMVESDEAATSGEKAQAWLAGQEKVGTSTEWVALKMLIAKQSGVDAEVRRWRSELVKRQQEDGGWGFVKGKPSDALATGTALYALGRVGGANGAIVKARRFLIATQGEEGYWVVPTTKNPKKDKPADVPTDVSNYWGSAWAVIGLCASLRDE